MGKGYKSLSEKEREEIRLVKDQLSASLPDKDVQVATYPASPEALKPGDFISFFYNGVLRSGLIVRSQKAPSGFFRSKANNNLINVYSLDYGSLTDDTIQLILNNLYRNRVACTYKYSTKILSLFFGVDSFRTFNLNNMSSVTQIMITTDES